MGFRKKVVCFSLLLLLLITRYPVQGLTNRILGEASESGNQGSSAKLGSFKTGNSVSSHGFGHFKRNHEGGEDDDAIFGDEKRKVHTGPNPLHNR